MVPVGAARRPQDDQGAHDRSALVGDGAQHAPVLAPVGRDHELFHGPADVVLDRDPVHVGEGLVEMDVAQVLVEHDQSDRACLEERVEKGEVGLHPVESLALARQPEDDGAAVATGHREDPEAAVEDPAVPVQRGHTCPPVAQRAAALGEPLGRGRPVERSGGEEDVGGPGQDVRRLVAEEPLRTRPPVADPALLVDAEHRHGHVLQQRSGLRPERPGSLLVPRGTLRRTPRSRSGHQAPFQGADAGRARHSPVERDFPVNSARARWFGHHGGRAGGSRVRRGAGRAVPSRRGSRRASRSASPRGTGRGRRGPGRRGRA